MGSVEAPETRITRISPNLECGQIGKKSANITKENHDHDKHEAKTHDEHSEKGHDEHDKDDKHHDHDENHDSHGHDETKDKKEHDHNDDNEDHGKLGGGKDAL